MLSNLAGGAGRRRTEGSLGRSRGAGPALQQGRGGDGWPLERHAPWLPRAETSDIRWEVLLFCIFSLRLELL